MDKENVGTNESLENLERSCLSVSERTDHFIKFFGKQRNNIEGDLLQAEQLKNSENLGSFLNRINDDFQKLQRYAADATIYLPLYNIRIAQECLKQLQEKLHMTQNSIFPKKKFAFKHKQIQSSSKDNIDSKRLNLRKNVDIEVNDCGFKNLQNQVLEKQPEDILGKDVSLHSLKHCTVCIKGSPSTVLLSQLIDCNIFLGPVSTSVFIEDCKQCVFIVACQQLRVHCSQDCAIYLHVTSRAVIEDCSSLRFAPYNWQYEGVENNFKMAGLDLSTNNWNDVDDFNWLSKDAPSPNWTAIPVEERLSSFK